MTDTPEFPPALPEHLFTSASVGPDSRSRGGHVTGSLEALLGALAGPDAPLWAAERDNPLLPPALCTAVHAAEMESVLDRHSAAANMKAELTLRCAPPGLRQELGFDATGADGVRVYCCCHALFTTLMHARGLPQFQGATRKAWVDNTLWYMTEDPEILGCLLAHDCITGPCQDMMGVVRAGARFDHLPVQQARADRRRGKCDFRRIDA